MWRVPYLTSRSQWSIFLKRISNQEKFRAETKVCQLCKFLIAISWLSHLAQIKVSCVIEDVLMWNWPLHIISTSIALSPNQNLDGHRQEGLFLSILCHFILPFEYSFLAGLIIYWWNLLIECHTGVETLSPLKIPFCVSSQSFFP